MVGKKRVIQQLNVFLVGFYKVFLEFLLSQNKRKKQKSDGDYVLEYFGAGIVKVVLEPSDHVTQIVCEIQYFD